MFGQCFSVRMVWLMGFGLWAFYYLSFGIGLFGPTWVLGLGLSNKEFEALGC